MQMFKKSVALVLSILMLLSMFTVALGMSAFAAESYKVTASSPQGLFTDVNKTYKAGDEFDLKFYLKIDQLLCNGNFYIRFDPNALFATSASKGAGLTGDSISFTAAGADSATYQNSKKCLKINFSCSIDAPDYSTEKVLCTVHFKVKDTISANQSISVDFQSLDGIKDAYDLDTAFPYIDYREYESGGVTAWEGYIVDAQKDNITARVELTGGSSEPSSQPATSATASSSATQAQSSTGAPAKDGYYIAGTLNSWSPNAAYKLTANASNPGEYMFLGLNASANDGIKVAYSANGTEFTTWYPDGMDNEYKITETGTYNIYFRPDGNSDWDDFYFYVEKAGDIESTTEAPEGTTAAPEGTTAAPEGTTAAPEATTAPVPEMYTFYYLPSADQEAAGDTYKLNFNDPNGIAAENWHQYDFVKTPVKVDGVNIYSVSVPKDFDDVIKLQYQVYNDAGEWVTQNEFENVKLSAYDNQVVKSDGSIDEKPTEPETEATTAAPTAEPTTTPEGTTTPEVTTTPEDTTAPEATTTPESTTVPEVTTAVPTVEPTTAVPTVKPTEAPTLAPSKVDFNKNPDEKSAVNAIAKAKSDADPKGSVFNKLKAKVAKTTKNSNKITWNKVSGAKKYIVMGNKCGNGNKFKVLKTTTGKSFTQKKLKKGTYYKYVILAVNSKGKVVSASKVIHVATKGGKNTNYKSLKLNKTKKTLKKGKTFKVKVKKKTKMNKKGTVKNHRKIKFESANTKIATVNAKGKIKAKKKGTTYVYAYAQNGVFKRINIKVK